MRISIGLVGVFLLSFLLYACGGDATSQSVSGNGQGIIADGSAIADVNTPSGGIDGGAGF